VREIEAVQRSGVLTFSLDCVMMDLQLNIEYIEGGAIEAVATALMAQSTTI
jgi:hypothetical protein